MTTLKPQDWISPLTLISTYTAYYRLFQSGTAFCTGPLPYVLNVLNDTMIKSTLYELSDAQPCLVKITCISQSLSINSNTLPPQRPSVTHGLNDPLPRIQSWYIHRTGAVKGKINALAGLLSNSIIISSCTWFTTLTVGPPLPIHTSALQMIQSLVTATNGALEKHVRVL